jgi:hypothetical protein
MGTKVKSRASSFVRNVVSSIITVHILILEKMARNLVTILEAKFIVNHLKVVMLLDVEFILQNELFSSRKMESFWVW